MNYTLTISPQSYLHCGSGEGGVLVDSDVVFHSSGFPLIPARRIKGLLRESMLEVLEISGEIEIESTIEKWFGKAGDDYANGILYKVGSGYVAPWTAIKAALSRVGNPGRDSIIEYTTTEIQQTALKDGIASKHSLRNYRVVNPRSDEDFRFEAGIETAEILSETDELLLQRAVHNLRFIGSRRNRGFGKVKCSLKSAGLRVKVNESRESLSASSKGYSVVLTALSPLIISKQDGDQSTLQTDDVISGAQLRGALARWFMRKEGLTKVNAHKNPVFYELFLSGSVHYGNLFLNDAKPAPAFIHGNKYLEKPPPLNVFMVKDQITKSIGGVGTLTISGDTLMLDKKTGPKKQSFFHNSRQDRTAGRNTGGELFYYEALLEDQQFFGSITGSEGALQLFAQHFLPEVQVSMGRSKSAQYGDVGISLSANDTNENKLPYDRSDYLLVVETPLILVNEFNFPALDEKSLVKELEEVLGHKPELDKVAGNTTVVESFNAIWKSKNGKYPAYSPGTTFKFRLANSTHIPDTLNIGKFTDWGYGECRILPFTDKITVKEKVDDLDRNIGNVPISTEVPLILQHIRNYETEKIFSLSLELRAIEAADSQRIRLNNHQCGRLEQVFAQGEHIGQVITFLKDLGDKPLGDALKKSDILLESYGENSDRTIKESITEPVRKFLQQNVNHLDDNKMWDAAKLYWITLFRSLRKFNQLKDQRDGNK